MTTNIGFGSGQQPPALLDPYASDAPAKTPASNDPPGGGIVIQPRSESEQKKAAELEAKVSGTGVFSFLSGFSIATPAESGSLADVVSGGGKVPTDKGGATGGIVIRPRSAAEQARQTKLAEKVSHMGALGVLNKGGQVNDLLSSGSDENPFAGLQVAQMDPSKGRISGR